MLTILGRVSGSAWPRREHWARILSRGKGLGCHISAQPGNPTVTWGMKSRALMPCTLGMPSPAGCPERSCRGSCWRPGQPGAQDPSEGWGDPGGHGQGATMLNWRTVPLLHHGHPQNYIPRVGASSASLVHLSRSLLWSQSDWSMETWCPQPSFCYFNSETKRRKSVSSISQELNVLDDINLL